MSEHTPAVSKSPNRSAAMTFGTVYLIVGVLGFFFPGSGGFFAAQGQGGMLFGLFEVDPFQNVLHLVLAAALLITGQSTVRSSQLANRGCGALFLALGLAGLLLTGTDAALPATNLADDVLHLLSGVILLATGILLERDAKRSDI